MFEKNPALTLLCVACACLMLGFGIAWAIKPAPEPEIEVTIKGVFVNGKKVDLSSLKLIPPALPDKSKRKPGDLPAGELEKTGPAADSGTERTSGLGLAYIPPGAKQFVFRACDCLQGDECKCVDGQCACSDSKATHKCDNAPKPKPVAIFQDHQSQPIVTQRGGGSEFLGLDRIIDRLIAWLSDKGKETELALTRREEALSRGWEAFKVAGIVVMIVVAIPVVWIAVSLQRIADSSATRILQMASLQKMHSAALN